MGHCLCFVFHALVIGVRNVFICLYLNDPFTSTVFLVIVIGFITMWAYFVLLCTPFKIYFYAHFFPLCGWFLTEDLQHTINKIKSSSQLNCQRQCPYFPVILPTLFRKPTIISQCKSLTKDLQHTI